ncbi:MAG: hypothetical protein KC461_14700 [Dehalococcoidia bacterium]|nr:hypothetical protein [Dehalococcoidia bacterium]MCA9851876.1 hypothetical protein [Dehalococcoidia bacterium]MCA9857861.1 hypothetical protein [Dehalococcoidia bacterium]MCB9482830.1 hypothetical protein [Dehalococcoidia bacterium]MCB9492123.1 hypothetical protein [Dehalococcoidia bacterium]
MFGDNGPVIDLDSAADAIAEAEVLVIGFDFTQDRMLIDLRSDPGGLTPPLVELVEPLGSATERTLWLQERRPDVAPPERFIFMGWPHTAQFLGDAALLDVIARRLKNEQGVDASDDLDGILRELRRRERLDTRSAVTGAEGFETLWSRSKR